MACFDAYLRTAKRESLVGNSKAACSRGCGGPAGLVSSLRHSLQDARRECLDHGFAPRQIEQAPLVQQPDVDQGMLDGEYGYDGREHEISEPVEACHVYSALHAGVARRTRSQDCARSSVDGDATERSTERSSDLMQPGGPGLRLSFPRSDR
jgi:hypothetical protein